MLTVYRPEYGDLWFRQQLLADEETMSYNHAWGGTIPFPESRWQEWHAHWIVNAGSERYYRYLKDEAGRFIGEIAYHYDTGTEAYLADVLLYAKYRGKGYGAQALELLCSAAKANGLQALCDDLAIDNPALRLFLRHGFTEVSRSDTAIRLKRVLQA